MHYSGSLCMYVRYSVLHMLQWMPWLMCVLQFVTQVTVDALAHVCYSVLHMLQWMP